MFAGKNPYKCIQYLYEFQMIELLFEEVPN